MNYINGKKFEMIIDNLINNVQILSYMNFLTNNYEIFKSEKEEFLIIDFDELQSENGKPTRVIYNMTDYNKPIKLYSGDIENNESRKSTLKKARILSAKTALDIWKEEILKGGKHEEPTN